MKLQAFNRCTIGSLVMLLLVVALTGRTPLLAQSAQTDANSPTNLPPGSVFELLQSLDAASAYDPAIAGELARNGRTYQEAGDHQSALLCLQHLLQVTRVNQGLYAEAQIDIIGDIIHSQSELGNWADVNRYYGLLEQLYLRMYELDDKRLEAGLRQVSSWYRYAASANQDGHRIDHLLKLNELLKLRLRIAESTLATDDPSLQSLNRSIASNERELYANSRVLGNSQSLQQGSRRGQADYRSGR